MSRRFFGLTVDADELKVIDALVEATGARSRSDLARHLIGEEARRRGLAVKTGTLNGRLPMHRRRQRVSEATAWRVVEMARSGDRTSDIAAELGLQPNTVTKIRSRNGLSVPRGTITTRGTS